MGASPIEGSSSSSSLGRLINARAIASICCSAAGKRAGKLPGAFLQARNVWNMRFHVGADLGDVVAREGAHLQVLGHAHASEHAAAFRHHARPCCSSL